ncbi:hypothetical protein Q5P01_013019 [Channa striata]|uniref:Mixed lineage kinase domain-containing protein n=1 Tax=Channa striata TaxID=64152 RepID=A0AA88MTC1_CHASR|nr:hypothetical protein Q5P01_013019 [Channa striata]
MKRFWRKTVRDEPKGSDRQTDDTPGPPAGEFSHLLEGRDEAFVMAGKALEDREKQLLDTSARFAEMKTVLAGRDEQRQKIEEEVAKLYKLLPDTDAGSELKQGLADGLKTLADLKELSAQVGSKLSEAETRQEERVRRLEEEKSRLQEILKQFAELDQLIRETKKVIMDFIEPILPIASQIYTLVETVKASKKRCRRVSDRVRALEDLESRNVC